MSTRCQLRFQTGSDGDQPTIAQVYRHSDGYPESVLPALERLQTLLRATGTERGPAYTAAAFIHVEKCRGMGLYLDRGPGREIDARTPTDVLDPRNWCDLDQPLFLLGYGVEDPSRGIHGDEEYLYVVELPAFDYTNPEATPDWTVKVSEHCGFPRWDEPTHRAFEEAEWAYEGRLSEAMPGGWDHPRCDHRHRSTDRSSIGESAGGTDHIELSNVVGGGIQRPGAIQSRG